MLSAGHQLIYERCAMSEACPEMSKVGPKPGCQKAPEIRRESANMYSLRTRKPGRQKINGLHYGTILDEVELQLDAGRTLWGDK